jgi:hypothetical protein
VVRYSTSVSPTVCGSGRRSTRLPLPLIRICPIASVLSSSRNAAASAVRTAQPGQQHQQSPITHPSCCRSTTACITGTREPALRSRAHCRHGLSRPTRAGAVDFRVTSMSAAMSARSRSTAPAPGAGDSTFDG